MSKTKTERPVDWLEFMRELHAIGSSVGADRIVVVACPDVPQTMFIRAEWSGPEKRASVSVNSEAFEACENEGSNFADSLRAHFLRGRYQIKE